MKCRILSDLHLEGYDWTYKHLGEDVVILAGDICSLTPVGVLRRDRLLDSIKVPVIYTPGNHEYYGERGTRKQALDLHKERLKPFKHVYFMDNGYVLIDHVRFLACTLWSDMVSKDGPAISDAMLKHAIEWGINDFNFLKKDDGSRGIIPDDMIIWHEESARWLKELVRDEDVKTVVVTHFLPSPVCIDERYKRNVLNAYFCADMTSIIGPPIALWVYGHTHTASRRTINETDVVCNPRGYSREVSGYDSNLIIEI